MSDTRESLSKGISTTVKTILIVEDDASVGKFLELVVSQETTHMPLLAATCERALEVVCHVKPDLFILDYYLDHHVSGLDLYDRLHAQPRLAAVPAIIHTASFKKTPARDQPAPAGGHGQTP